MGGRVLGGRCDSGWTRLQGHTRSLSAYMLQLLCAYGMRSTCVRHGWPDTQRQLLCALRGVVPGSGWGPYRYGAVQCGRSAVTHGMALVVQGGGARRGLAGAGVRGPCCWSVGPEPSVGGAGPSACERLPVRAYRLPPGWRLQEYALLLHLLGCNPDTPHLAARAFLPPLHPHPPPPRPASNPARHRRTPAPRLCC